MVKKETKKWKEQVPTQDDEEVLFACWGKTNKKDDKNYVFEEGKPVELTLVKIQESETYRFTYKCKIPDVEKPVILLGNASLNNGCGLGGWDVARVEEGATLRITYEGQGTSKKTKRKFYKIKVEVAE